MYLCKCFYSVSLLLVTYTLLEGCEAQGTLKYTKADLIQLREEVRQMFEHAYSSYLRYAYPYDELRPLTCDGHDTWGSYSLTLIDALDTLAVMGNHTEFKRVVDILSANANFDANINVSVFETNIRIVGGLISAHLLSQRAGVSVEPGWPCNGPLLRLAEGVAKRLLAAFDTPTGMPYGTVNLRHGIPHDETSITCTAGIGTFVLEFGALSRLTGDPVYEEVALNALHALFQHRSPIGLVGNHIDVLNGRWTAQDSGIGAGVDSYFEYLVKGSLLLQKPELMAMFSELRESIDKYLKNNNWYLWVSMMKGQVTLPVFQSLEAYWPGVLSLIGDVNDGMKSMHNYHEVWKQYGFTPEFYNVASGEVGQNRESYPLRPELAESAMYLYRATRDPTLLDIGVDILRSIQHSARTDCGYATIKDTRDHSLENRMESFFLAETTKYLYLLFDTENFLHNDGQTGTIHTLPSGRECILDAGGYIFNTEAHPMDPGALHCCSGWFGEEKIAATAQLRGEALSAAKVPTMQDEPAHKLHEEREALDDSNIPQDGLLMGLENSNSVDVIRPSTLPSPNTQIETMNTLTDTQDSLKTLLEAASKEMESSQEASKTAPSDNPRRSRQEVINLLLKYRSLLFLEDKMDHWKWLEHTKERNQILEELVKKEPGIAKLVQLTKIFEDKVLETKGEVDKLAATLLKVTEGDKCKVEEKEGIFKAEVGATTVLGTDTMGRFSEEQITESPIEAVTNQFSKTFSEEQKTESPIEAGTNNFSHRFLEGQKTESPIEADTNQFSNVSEEGLEHEDKTEAGKWQTNEIAYQVDDNERVSPVSRLDSSPLFTETSPSTTEAPVAEFVSRFLISSGTGGMDFDPQLLLERIRTGPGYRRNLSWETQFERLSCIPQTFLTRITMLGEFFND